MTIRSVSAPIRPYRRLRAAVPLLLGLSLAGCGMLPERLPLPWRSDAPRTAPPAEVRTAPPGSAPAVDWNGNPIAPPPAGASTAAGAPAAGATAPGTAADRPTGAPAARSPGAAPADPAADASRAALDAALAPVPGDARGTSPSRQGLSEDAVAARQFRLLDTDRDGTLDPDEVAGLPRLREAFGEADADRDGRLSFEELRRYALQQRAQRTAGDAPAAPAEVSAPSAPAVGPAATPAPAGGTGLRPPVRR